MLKDNGNWELELGFIPRGSDAVNLWMIQIDPVALVYVHTSTLLG